MQLATFSEKNITVNYALDETEVTSDPPTLIADGHASNNAYPIDYNYWSTGSDGTGNSSALRGTGTGNVTFTGVENNVSASTSRQYINIPVAILNDVINEFHETIILKIDETGNDDVAGAGAIDKFICVSWFFSSPHMNCLWIHDTHPFSSFSKPAFFSFFKSLCPQYSSCVFFGF